jgi:hypothetical protein
MGWHHGRDSCRKDGCHPQPSRTTRGEVSSQDQRQGKVVLVWNSLRIESAKWAVRHIAIYATREPKRWLGTHSQVNERRAKCIGLFAARVIQHSTLHKLGLIKHIRNTNPPGAVGNQGGWSVAFATLKGVCGLHLCDSRISTGRRRDNSTRTT